MDRIRLPLMSCLTLCETIIVAFLYIDGNFRVTVTQFEFSEQGAIFFSLSWRVDIALALKIVNLFRFKNSGPPGTLQCLKQIPHLPDCLIVDPGYTRKWCSRNIFVSPVKAARIDSRNLQIPSDTGVPIRSSHAIPFLCPAKRPFLLETYSPDGRVFHLSHPSYMGFVLSASVRFQTAAMQTEIVFCFRCQALSPWDGTDRLYAFEWGLLGGREPTKHQIRGGYWGNLHARWLFGLVLPPGDEKGRMRT